MLLLTRDEETGQQLDDKAVRDEAMTLFLAGHETTALATGYSWYLLAQHPEYFERLRAEGLPFALQVIKESMRLYPPVFVMARMAREDTEIGGYPVHEYCGLVFAYLSEHGPAPAFELPRKDVFEQPGRITFKRVLA